MLRGEAEGQLSNSRMREAGRGSGGNFPAIAGSARTCIATCKADRFPEIIQQKYALTGVSGGETGGIHKPFTANYLISLLHYFTRSGNIPQIGRWFGQ